MGIESSQKWLERNRPPRVQITYDVETGGAIEKKELPLVVGILADLSGMPDPNAAAAPPRFIEIDGDNFNQVLEKFAPRIDVSKLGISGTDLPQLSGVLTFKNIVDFKPDALVKQVAGLKELYETRRELRDLMAKLDGNAKLEEQLTTLFFKDGAELDATARNKALDDVINATAAGNGVTDPVKAKDGAGHEDADHGGESDGGGAPPPGA